MKCALQFLSVVAVLVPATVFAFDESTEDKKVKFSSPTRVMASGKAIRVDYPGYASPCVADLNGDGKKDLLVGQYGKGRIHVFHNLGNGTYGASEYLKAGSEIVEIPDVW